MTKNGHFDPKKGWRSWVRTWYAHFLIKLDHLRRKNKKKINKITPPLVYPSVATMAKIERRMEDVFMLSVLLELMKTINGM